MVKRTLLALPLMALSITAKPQLRHQKRGLSHQDRETLSMSDLLGKTSTFISQSNNTTSASDATGESSSGSNDLAMQFPSSSSGSNGNGYSGSESLSSSYNGNSNGVFGSGCRRKGGCKKKKNRQNIRGYRTQGGENI